MSRNKTRSGAWLVLIPALLLAVPARGADGTLVITDNAVDVHTIAVLGHSDSIIRDLLPGTPPGQSGQLENRFGPVRVMKEIDGDSPDLWLAWFTGSMFDSAKLELFDLSSSSTPYLTIDIDNVRVMELQVAADSEGEGPPREMLGLAYSKVRWTTAGGETGCWDIGANPGGGGQPC